MHNFPAVVKREGALLYVLFQIGEAKIFSKDDVFKENYTDEIIFLVENKFSASS